MAWKSYPLLLTTLAYVACNRGSAPVIDDPGNQVAVVGHELRVDIFASDPDGDSLSYSSSSATLPEFDHSKAITVAPDGHAIFSITPVVSQLGTHTIEFSVSDGKHTTSLPVQFDIRGATAEEGQPVFRKPEGDSTILDVAKCACLELEILVSDKDTAQISLAQEPPIIQGAELDAAADGLSGSWKWCPSRAQTQAADRYTLTLSAQDLPENPPVLKDFGIILRRGRPGTDCPGAAPMISHTPQDFTGQLDIPITIDVSDDVGLKDPPLLMYSYTDPALGDVCAPSSMVTLTMALTSGDTKQGQWTAKIPNKTASMGASSEADLWYSITLVDDDDAAGDCDHQVDSPPEGAHKIHITNDGSGVAALCEPCSFDVQCGPGLCLLQETGNFCGNDCDAGNGCGDGYDCSPEPVQSVEGTSRQQCIPPTGACGESTGNTGSCTEDDNEEDDTLEQASSKPPFTLEEEHQAGLCGGDRDDWHRFELTELAAVYASIESPLGDAINLDLALTDANGNLLKSSRSSGSTEDLTPDDCLEPGSYYIQVHGATNGTAGPYTFSVEAAPDECGDDTGDTGSIGPFTGACCSANNSPGCDDAGVSECVCNLAPNCCTGNWTELCVATATVDCAADCAHECCDQGPPGCIDAAIEDCVCAEDSLCCTAWWDDVCVREADELLCSAPDACMPDDGDGSCCEAHLGVGCDNNEVEECVCFDNPNCCAEFTGQWSQACVDQIAISGCGMCPR